MAADPDHPVERFFAALPGWLFFIGAVALLAMMVITPPVLEMRDLAWQQRLMQLQLERLERQHNRYTHFHASLEAGDPVLLERLAFTHLRLTPTDRELLDPAGLPRLITTASHQHAPQPNFTPVSSSAAIDAWLREPLPVVGLDIAAPRPINTRLARLSRGHNRIGLIAAAFACFLGALWYGQRPAPKSRPA